jgi:hypothetical protein
VTSMTSIKRFAWNLGEVAFCVAIGIAGGYFVFGGEHLSAAVIGALIGNILARDNPSD